MCVCMCVSVLGFDRVPWWGTLCISLGCAIVTALVVWFVVCPRLEKKIKRELNLNIHRKILNHFYVSCQVLIKYSLVTIVLKWYTKETPLLLQCFCLVHEFF